MLGIVGREGERGGWVLRTDPAQTDAARHATSRPTFSSPSMERNMTAAAFDEYLQDDPALAALTGKLQPGVDGDLLINTVETAIAKDAVAVLQPFISGEVGLIGKLVIKINNFLASEKAAREKDKKGKKRMLDEAKVQRLQDSMMKEREGQVTSSTMQQLFQARTGARDC